MNYNSAKRKLENNQMNNGAWPWFEGGRQNRYITQHIITGFGHLKHLNVESKEVSPMIQKAMNYLDAEFVQEYKDIRKYDKTVDLSQRPFKLYAITLFIYAKLFPRDRKNQRS